MVQAITVINPCCERIDSVKGACALCSAKDLPFESRQPRRAAAAAATLTPTASLLVLVLPSLVSIVSQGNEESLSEASRTRNQRVASRRGSETTSQHRQLISDA